MIDKKVLLAEMQEKKDELKSERPFNDEFCRGFAFAMEFVKVQPKVMEWIPSSEPPETPLLGVYSEDVLTALKWYDGDIAYSVGWYNSKAKKWYEDTENCKVVAWMPLPSPWKGEENV